MEPGHAKSAREVIAQIERDLEEGQRATALARLGLLLDMKLEDTADYEARGRHLLMNGMYEEARRDLETAVSRNTEDAEVYFDLGAALSTLGRREDAIDALRGAVRLMPDSDDVAFALSWELERLGRYDEALEVLHRYAKSNHHPHTYRHWGRIRGKQKKWKSAFTSYTKAVWLNKPDEKKQAMVQKYNSIMKIRRAAASMDPGNTDSFFMLGVMLYQAEWYEAAADAISTGVLMRPEAGACLLIGEIWESVTRVSEAIDVYKDAIKKLSGTAPNSDMTSLYESLVKALYKCGRRREVMQYGAEAISLKVASRKMRKYYKRVKEEPDLPDEDQVSGGWAAPYYSGYQLRFPD